MQRHPTISAAEPHQLAVAKTGVSDERKAALNIKFHTRSLTVAVALVVRPNSRTEPVAGHERTFFEPR